MGLLWSVLYSWRSLPPKQSDGMVGYRLSHFNCLLVVWCYRQPRRALSSLLMIFKRVAFRNTNVFCRSNGTLHCVLSAVGAKLKGASKVPVQSKAAVILFCILTVMVCKNRNVFFLFRLKLKLQKPVAIISSTIFFSYETKTITDAAR